MNQMFKMLHQNNQSNRGFSYTHACVELRAVGLYGQFMCPDLYMQTVSIMTDEFVLPQSEEGTISVPI